MERKETDERGRERQDSQELIRRGRFIGGIGSAVQEGLRGRHIDAAIEKKFSLALSFVRSLLRVSAFKF
jgi:hypothetical protein